MSTLKTRGTPPRGGTSRPAPARRTPGSAAPSRQAAPGNGRRLLVRRTLLALVVVLLLVGVWAVKFSSLLDVTSVRILGVSGADAAAVRAQSQVPAQTPLADADLAGISSRVASIPVVDHVEVTRSWPHTVVVDVTARRAVLTVKNTQGQLQVVDRHGYAFAAATAPTSAAPLLTLAGTPTADRQSAIATAYQVLASLTPAHRSAMSDLTVQGAQSVELTIHGVRVTWGDGSGGKLKNTVLTALLKAAQKPSGRHEMNVSTPQAPTVG